MDKRIVIRTKEFKKSLKNVKDKKLKIKIFKQIQKIIENPFVGKPLKHKLKGERTIYIKPYRLIYFIRENEIVLLRFLHRDDVYR